MSVKVGDAVYVVDDHARKWRHRRGVRVRGDRQRWTVVQVERGRGGQGQGLTLEADGVRRGVNTRDTPVVRA